MLRAQSNFGVLNRFGRDDAYEFQTSMKEFQRDLLRFGRSWKCVNQFHKAGRRSADTRKGQ